MQSKFPALAKSCSAQSAGVGKGPPDLNYLTCRYFLEKESALCDATMNSSLAIARYTFSRMFHAVLKSILSYELCICAVLSAMFKSFATSSGLCLVFLPNMQPLPVFMQPSDIQSVLMPPPALIDAAFFVSCYATSCLPPIVCAASCFSKSDVILRRD
jgi:hypothetical protein